MPFIDANTALASASRETYDHTIVGAGAAGILLAVELSKRGQKVLLIESGHFENDEDRQNLNQIEETGKPLGNAQWTRKRVLGGTTTAWGGQALPFTALDFEIRDWVENSGWPISRDDLEPYYRRAGLFMGVDALDYGDDISRILKRPPSPFRAERLDYHYSKWTNSPNFFRRRRSELEAGVTVLYNAEVLSLELNETGHCHAVEVSNFREERQKLAVNEVVLATGGLETNRLLLLTDQRHPGGIARSSGWLGRGFMEHPCMEIGVVDAQDQHRLQSWLGTRVYKGLRYSQKLAPSRAWQEDNRLLNITGGFMWLYGDGMVGPLTQLKSFLQRPNVSDLVGMIRNSGQLMRGLWALAIEGLVYKPGATPLLVVSAEQAPTQDSRITLSEDLDRFGRPKARLHWTIGDQTWETIVRYGQLMATELAEAGLGTVRLFDHVRMDEPDWRRHLSDVNHHTGGARMSAEPDSGVVDKNLRVWGTDNLYVCSAAVFPTSYHSNPTLTVLALAERLVDRLTDK